MTENEAIIQLNFDMEMIRFNPDTGENLTLEQIKAHNEDNYKTYLADELAITALTEIQQYRAIGTVEGYKRALEISKENFRVSMEYKAKVQEYETIGTIEDFKALKEDGRFLEFLYNHIPPNEMKQYLSMYRMKDKVAVNGYADQSGLMPAT